VGPYVLTVVELAVGSAASVELENIVETNEFNVFEHMHGNVVSILIISHCLVDCNLPC
jgi:hypothetical protein